LKGSQNGWNNFVQQEKLAFYERNCTKFKDEDLGEEAISDFL